MNKAARLFLATATVSMRVGPARQPKHQSTKAPEPPFFGVNSDETDVKNVDSRARCTDGEGPKTKERLRRTFGGDLLCDVFAELMHWILYESERRKE